MAAEAVARVGYSLTLWSFEVRAVLLRLIKSAMAHSVLVL